MVQMTMIEAETNAQVTSRGKGIDEQEGNSMIHAANCACVHACGTIAAV